MWSKQRAATTVATLAIGGLGLFAGLAPAASAHPGGRAQLTDEQQACLEEQGITKPTKPAEGEAKPTDEEREARHAKVEAAAAACGFELPARGPGGPGGHGPKLDLTDEQKSCLEENGVTKPEKPAEGEERTKPTDEERQARRTAFEAAAETCGIELPERPAEGQAPAGDQAPAEDSSVEGSDQAA